MSFFLLPDLPPIPAGDQLATPVSYPRSRPAGFAAIPAPARARGDSVTNMSAENVSEAGEHVIDGWIGDAETVLKFVSPVQLTLFAFYCTD